MYFFSTPLYRTDITDVKDIAKDPAKLKRNKEFAKKLEENGIEIILPQRDVDQTLLKSEIYKQELELIKKSEGVIVILSDTRGIYLEAGYAKALGKKLFGLKVKETKPITPNGWISQWFELITEDIEELIQYLKEHSP